jgi:hypothetical protein
MLSVACNFGAFVVDGFFGQSDLLMMMKMKNSQVYGQRLQV